MGVGDPFAATNAVGKKVIELNESIQSLRQEVVLIKKALGVDNAFRTYFDVNKSMYVYVKGKMVFWQKHPDAARYILTLTVCVDDGKYVELDTIEIPRQTLYHTFGDIESGMKYLVNVEPELYDGTRPFAIQVYIE